jgi:hypothetical protein
MKNALVLTHGPAPGLSAIGKLGNFKNMGMRLRCEPNKSNL